MHAPSDQSKFKAAITQPSSRGTSPKSKESAVAAGPQHRRSASLAVVLAIAIGAAGDRRLTAAENPTGEDSPAAAPAERDDVSAESALPAKAADRQENRSPAGPFGDPPDAVRLSPKHRVWIDKQRKLVIFDGRVCLREGQLEMFVCPAQTKEHESVVAADVVPQIVHAALLALGAEPGNTVQFSPEFVPASGTEIEVIVLWQDKQGRKHKAFGQQWVRDAESGKAMSYPWVFAGSGLWVDERTGRKHYMANDGDFICVSNFPTAMLDVPVKSSDANRALLFDAFTERIPPLQTPVRIVLRPKIKAKAENNDTPPSEPKSQAE